MAQVIKTIFFDLGNVLINFSHDLMCQNLSELTGLNQEWIYKKLFVEGIGKDLEIGTISPESVHSFFKSLSSKAFTVSEFEHAASHIFSLKEDMLEILERLKNKDISLFLLSNTNASHFSYIEYHYPSVLEYFNGFILSHEVKARKPDKEIFEIALKRVKTDPSNCFYIDDIEENIMAGSSLGIESHHFQGKEKLLKSLEKRGL